MAALYSIFSIAMGCNRYGFVVQTLSVSRLVTIFGCSLLFIALIWDWFDITHLTLFAATERRYETAKVNSTKYTKIAHNFN